MLKTIALHILGGIIAFLGEKLIFRLFFPDVIVPLAVICIIMTAFYIGVGYILRNTAFEKIIITMQVIAFLSRNISVFGDAFAGPMSVLNGGSRIWMRTAMYTIPYNEWSEPVFYALYFFAFPAFIYAGRLIANLINQVKPSREKEGIWGKIILLHTLLGFLLGICRMCFILNKSEAHIMLFVLAAVSFILYTGCGIWIRKASGDKLFLLMSNISLLGLALANMSVLSNYLIYTLVGGGLVFADMGNFLFPDGVLSKFTNVLIFIPPLLILLGQQIGNKLLKKKEKALENQ